MESRKGIEDIRWAFHESDSGSLERAVSAYVALGRISPDSAPSMYMKSLLEMSGEPLWTVFEWLGCPEGSWEREWAESRKDRDWLLMAEMRVCVLRRLLNQNDWASAFNASDSTFSTASEKTSEKVCISVIDAMVWCNKTADSYGWELPYWFEMGGLVRPVTNLSDLEGVKGVEIFENRNAIGPFVPTTGEWLKVANVDPAFNLWVSDLGQWTFPL